MQCKLRYESCFSFLFLGRGTGRSWHAGRVLFSIKSRGTDPSFCCSYGGVIECQEHSLATRLLFIDTYSWSLLLKCSIKYPEHCAGSPPTAPSSFSTLCATRRVVLAREAGVGYDEVCVTCEDSQLLEDEREESLLFFL